MHCRLLSGMEGMRTNRRHAACSSMVMAMSGTALDTFTWVRSWVSRAYIRHSTSDIISVHVSRTLQEYSLCIHKMDWQEQPSVFESQPAQSKAGKEQHSTASERKTSWCWCSGNLYPPGNDHISHLGTFGTSSSKVPLKGDMLVPWRLYLFAFFAAKTRHHMNVFCRGALQSWCQCSKRFWVWNWWGELKGLGCLENWKWVA